MKLKAADLFCGAGGATTGLMRACLELGIDVDVLAVNHWPTAVHTHTLNHPSVKHLCESVERIDPLVVVPGGRLHLLLAGPECTHFSTARGGRPVNPQSRASAWHILKWAQELYIDTILIENVPEFRTWGPIGANHKPLKSKRGQTYRAFIEALRSLGYRVEDRILNAADYGDPTTRKRLFILARRGRHEVRWPMPTHSKTGAATLFGTPKRWKAAREVIDWTIPGKSIFTRKKPLKPATIARIMAGLEKFGGADLQPFLVVLRRNQAGQSIDGPIPTLTTSGANVGLAQPFLMHITHGRDTDRTRSIDSPLPTITTAKRGEIGIVESFVLQQQSGGAPRSTEQPLPTIATDGAISIVQPFIFANRTHNAPKSIHEPIPPLCTGNHITVVEPFIISAGGPKCPARPVDQPIGTVLTRDHRALVEPFIVDAAFGRGDDTRRTKSVDELLGTIPGSNRFAIAEPFLTKYNSTATGAYSVDEPIDTISTRDRFGLVQPVINGYVLDIHFRMLQPHELAAATGFPKSYVFHGNREDVVKQIGNSWPGELSFALNRTIVEDYTPKRKRARSAA